MDEEELLNEIEKGENQEIEFKESLKLLLNISNDTALRELSQLKSINLIERKGVGRSTYYVIRT